MQLETLLQIGSATYAELYSQGINAYLTKGYNEKKQRVSTIQLKNGSIWTMDPDTKIYSLANIKESTFA